MAILEERAKRNGVPLPIQCLHMKLTEPPRANQLHYHDYIELLFGTGGRARATVGNRNYVFGQGELLIIHTHEPHDVVYEDGECSYIVIKFLPEVLLGNEQTYSEYGCALLLMENMGGRQNLFRAEELADTPLGDLFAHMMCEWKEEKLGYELGLRADVTLILLHILRKWRDKNPSLAEAAAANERGGMMQKAMTYVKEQYAEATEDRAAAVCGVSVSYFSRLFKRAMKSGFSAYVNRVRLREAERLLLTTDKSVTEIALEVGFSTSSYFIDCFRRTHNTTPHRYRCLLRGEGKA